jgi:hypothetical protein
VVEGDSHAACAFSDDHGCDCCPSPLLLLLLLLLLQNLARRNSLLTHTSAALRQLQKQLDAVDAFVKHHFQVIRYYTVQPHMVH